MVRKTTQSTSSDLLRPNLNHDTAVPCRRPVGLSFYELFTDSSFLTHRRSCPI